MLWADLGIDSDFDGLYRKRKNSENSDNLDTVLALVAGVRLEQFSDFDFAFGFAIYLPPGSVDQRVVSDAALAVDTGYVLSLPHCNLLHIHRIQRCTNGRSFLF